MNNLTRESELHFKDGVVECPKCHHNMRINMQICDECGYTLSAQEMAAVRSQLGRSFWGWILKVFIGVAVISFIVFQFFS